MRTLSLDIGSKIIGLAITDIDQKIITPLPRLAVAKFDAKKMLALIQKQLNNFWSEINHVIIGNSSHEDYQQQNSKILGYQDQIKRVIKAHTSWEISEEFEDYTSIESFKSLKELNYSPKKIKENIDSYAAAIMLSNFFFNRGKDLICSF